MILYQVSVSYCVILMSLASQSVCHIIPNDLYIVQVHCVLYACICIQYNNATK